jgi:excisionase family DNA binding protein
MSVDDELLSVRQVADICKVQPKTVRRWISAGELSATRANERADFRIWRSEVTRKFGSAAGETGDAPAGTGDPDAWDEQRLGASLIVASPQDQ